MKRIYILDEQVSSSGNGIGTFLRELVGCLKQIEVSVCWIIFNAECCEFTIREEGGLTYFYFPKFCQGEFITHPTIVDYFFRLYIDDSPENVFCINHSPCVKLMQQIKKSHPLSKIIFIIHDLAWTSVLLGNSRELKKIVSERSKQEIQEKYSSLLYAFDEEKMMCETADKIICLSQSTFRLLKEVYLISEENIRCIPNGLTDHCSGRMEKKESLRKGFLIPEDEKIILFVGRLSKAKGFMVLLDAFEDVLKNQPNSRLMIAGSISTGNLPVIEDTVVASRISFLGQVKSCELTKWYRMADVGVISSYSEQCSYVGIEMMMCGLPVVASDGFGVSDMFHNGQNARVASIGGYMDTEVYRKNLSDAVTEVLGSKDLAEQISRGGRAVYKSRYQPGVMKEKYEELLLEIFSW